MKFDPVTTRERVIYMLVFVLIQQGGMYVGFQVFHWSFLLTGLMATVSGILLGLLVTGALRSRGVR